MNYAAKKNPLLRYGLVVLLLIVLISILIAGVLYLSVHYKKAQKLEISVNNLISERESSSLIDSCIIKLYSADNYSRLYTVTGDKAYLQKFTDDINKITVVVDKIKSNQSKEYTQGPSKLKYLVNQKTEKTNTYIKLRHLTDSLIRYSASISNSVPQPLNNADKIVVNYKPVVKIEHKVVVDTIKKINDPKPKAKLLGRIFSVFSKKKEAEKPSSVIVKRDSETKMVSVLSSIDGISKPANVSQTAAPAPSTLVKNYYQAINTANNKLRKNEQQVLMLNNNLIDEIIGSLNAYKAIEQHIIDNSNAELKENISDSSFENQQLFVAGIIFLIVLTLLILYNIWKGFKNEQRIIEYGEKAEQYAKLKSRFLAGMSHEIRTPLNSIIGFSEQLSLENLRPAQMEQLEAIKSSSEMLLELVNEILDFSKYETGKMSFDSVVFKPENIINEVFKNMQVQATKKRIVLENQINIDKGLHCEGDKVRLKQVIMNLLGNAIKFTVEGKVTLSAYLENKPNDIVVLKVTVKDTGLGITKENLPHIFEEFSQVAEAQKATANKGTGLGLAICKKIIELQGGSISVSSEPGQGSAFSFEIPLKKCEVNVFAAEQFFTDEEMAQLVKGRNILLAEDNQLNVLLGTTILKKWKINYDVAYNGKEAYELFQKNNYDVVLTDIQMPEMDGMELTQHIRRYHIGYKSNVPIIALTASVLKEDRDIYFNAGVNDMILKPFLEKNLIEKISLSIQSNLTEIELIS